MKHRLNHQRLAGAAVLSALVILALPIGTAAAADCSADIDGEFRKETEGSDHKVYVWKADITTEEICAKVQFTLWAREVDRNGETKEQNHLFQIKASSREVKSRKVNLVVDLGTDVTEWRFKIYKCEPCG